MTARMRENCGTLTDAMSADDETSERRPEAARRRGHARRRQVTTACQSETDMAAVTPILTGRSLRHEQRPGQHRADQLLTFRPAGGPLAVSLPQALGVLSRLHSRGQDVCGNPPH